VHRFIVIGFWVAEVYAPVARRRLSAQAPNLSNFRSTGAARKLDSNRRSYFTKTELQPTVTGLLPQQQASSINKPSIYIILLQIGWQSGLPVHWEGGFIINPIAFAYKLKERSNKLW